MVSLTQVNEVGVVEAAQANGLEGAVAKATVPVNGSSSDTPDIVPGGAALGGGAFTGLILRLGDPKDPVFFQRLADRVLQAPGFFRHAPVVIDLADRVGRGPLNVAEIGRRLRQHGLVPIGVQNGTDEHNKDAVNAGYAVFSGGRPLALDEINKGQAALTGTDPKPHRADGDSVGASAAARLVSQPIRSGRQVYAHGGDLVVTAAVGAGAEILADGHIHVYGPLRGRALAGVSGDRAASIFCLSLEAELISIAGYWLVRDDLPDDLIGRAARIQLDGERVRISPLAAQA